jgi:hypothetical protein
MLSKKVLLEPSALDLPLPSWGAAQSLNRRKQRDQRNRGRKFRPEEPLALENSWQVREES